MVLRMGAHCFMKVIRKCPKSVVKLLLLSGLALILYSYSTKFRHVIPKINTCDILGPAFTLLQSNGSIHIDELESLSDISEDQKLVLMRDIRNSIAGVFNKCASEAVRIECQSDQEPKKSLLTLFTTWVYDPDKFSIYNRTLLNWKTLGNVNLIVFSNSSEVQYYSQLAGWHTLPVIEEADGVPVLSAMFSAAMEKFDSIFYGFANGDIIFTDSILVTLQRIWCDLIIKQLVQNMLIIGRRVNVPADLITNEVAKSWAQIISISQEHGSLFQTDAEDYFITDRNFPWKNFLPVVVGRRGYDNWIVSYSRYRNITVIDSSESILCVHQTLETRGNYEGLSKGNYNLEIIEKMDMPFESGWGRTFCSGLKSWYNICGNIVISHRSKLPSECTDLKWSYRVLKLFGLVN